MTRVTRIGGRMKKGAAGTLRHLRQISPDICGRYLRTSAADISGHLRQMSEPICRRSRRRGAAPPERGLPDRRNRSLFDYRTVVFAATTGLFLFLVTHTLEGDFGKHLQKKLSGDEANLGFLHH